MMNNLVEEFSKLKLADGQVLDIFLSAGSLKVRYLDWQEREHTLIFDDVCGLEAFSVEGEELSHGTVDTDDPFIERASKILLENIDGLRCFCFWSAWSDQPLMRIVARSVKLIE